MSSIRHIRAWRRLALLLVVVFSIHAPVMAYVPAAGGEEGEPGESARELHQPMAMAGRAPANTPDAAALSTPTGAPVSMKGGHCHERNDESLVAASESTSQGATAPFDECCEGSCPMMLCHLTFTSSIVPLLPLTWGGLFTRLHRANFYASQPLTPLMRPPIPA